MVNNKNKGYSLVEMIIVLAIVGILATMSLISLTLINNARAKDASNKLGSELNQIRKKSIEMTPTKEEINLYGGTYSASKEYRYGMIIYEDTGKYVLSEVICEYDTTNKCYKYLNLGSALTTDNTTVKLSSKVGLTFKGKYTKFKDGTSVTCSDKTQPGVKTSDDVVCVMFDKHGNCLSGYGDYFLSKKNANEVARVIVKQNGSIVVR